MHTVMEVTLTRFRFAGLGGSGRLRVQNPLMLFDLAFHPFPFGDCPREVGPDVLGNLGSSGAGLCPGVELFVLFEILGGNPGVPNR